MRFARLIFEAKLSESGRAKGKLNCANGRQLARERRKVTVQAQEPETLRLNKSGLSSNHYTRRTTCFILFRSKARESSRTGKLLSRPLHGLIKREMLLCVDTLIGFAAILLLDCDYKFRSAPSAIIVSEHCSSVYSREYCWLHNLYYHINYNNLAFLCIAYNALIFNYFYNIFCFFILINIFIIFISFRQVTCVNRRMWINQNYFSISLNRTCKFAEVLIICNFR